MKTAEEGGKGYQRLRREQSRKAGKEERSKVRNNYRSDRPGISVSEETKKSEDRRGRTKRKRIPKTEEGAEEEEGGVKFGDYNRSKHRTGNCVNEKKNRMKDAKEEGKRRG